MAEFLICLETVVLLACAYGIRKALQNILLSQSVINDRLVSLHQDYFKPLDKMLESQK